VGDVAYMILADKGVQDVLPELAHKKPNELRMDDYFLWPSIGNHRLRLQTAVRGWLLKHSNCCAAPPIIWTANLSAPKLRMPATDLTRARTRFSQLRPGMSPAQVLAIAGKPDGIDRGNDGSTQTPQSSAERIGLLGYCAGDHNENLAYIYFIERWTDKVALRDPLRDRYVILFFSSEGKFTRMFSNVAVIPPIFPSIEAIWQRLMWGEPVKKK
jgi:quinol monooxygenase YgiN